MSWSTFINPTPASEFEAAINQLELPHNDTSPPTPEMLDQFDAAKTAIIILQQSGAIGDPHDGMYGANLSGHANPGHAGNEHVGGDVINLNVYRTTLVAPATETPPLVESGA